jgi:hypothetical protein
LRRAWVREQSQRVGLQFADELHLEQAGYECESALPPRIDLRGGQRALGSRRRIDPRLGHERIPIIDEQRNRSPDE